MKKTDREKALEEALGCLLDAIDYQQGNCSITQPVGAVLPPVLLQKARMAMVDTTTGRNK